MTRSDLRPVPPAGTRIPQSVALYLPQFHPIPENDEWWGPGFTEWDNVRRARPLFRGHVQPKVPGELGYYDLRDPAVRVAQAELAADYGISAFCYYHYWFNGHRLLERPFTDVLHSKAPALPFMLCWANENWTRAWDGGAQHVLVAQKYSPADDLAHFRALAPVFEDPRYVRVDGRPVFLLYRAGLLPHPGRTAETWHHEAHRLGIAPPWLCHVESHGEGQIDPVTIGFDAAVEFVPVFDQLPRRSRASYRLGHLSSRGLLPKRFRHHIMSYDVVADCMLAKPVPDYPWYRMVTPGWDNTARRRTAGVVVRGNTPQRFEHWTTEVLVQGAQAGSHFIFINAWNEWGEGAYLEPDAHWGRAFLEAHARAQEAATAQLTRVTAPPTA